MTNRTTKTSTTRELDGDVRSCFAKERKEKSRANLLAGCV
jgi:hypothetical protein